ncbi:MAG: MBL fold metallo-hydrolase [Planctomycetota bacterium]
MKITAFGHIAYLLEMTGEEGAEPVRILGDPWLSDYAAGDLMGRFPRLRFDASALPALDAIFISHSHTDHFDPESLVGLWRDLPNQPFLLLPQSLRHLDSLLREFLAGVEIRYLSQGDSVEVRGVEFSAYFNPETRATNEDDVMVLVAKSAREVFLSESDALLPFYDPETREHVSQPVFAKGVETACFLTAKNELEASMSMLSASDLEDRQARISRSLERTYAEIEEIFVPFEGLEADLWGADHLVRFVGGQGMCYPQALDSQWNHVLFPIRLSDRANMEREIAEQCGHALSISEFEPGTTYTLEGGNIASAESATFLETLDREEERFFQPSLEVYDDFPVAPLREGERNADEQERQILEKLNGRFLPYLIGARNPPLEHLLAANEGGEYRIRIRYGTLNGFRDRDYVVSFDACEFIGREVEAEADEHYWANDLEDVFEGVVDEFSIFCRKPIGGKAQRFWACLGLPFLNGDLVAKKLRSHFERAARGESLEAWVLPFYEHG